MKIKQKSPDQLGFKDFFGTATMGMTESIASVLMSSAFMLYLTDYAGLGAMGAVVGSSVLLFSRIFDAVNDPLEGYIIDRAKVGKHGKYKPFMILSILMIALGISCLFFVPSGNFVMTVAWVILFYLIYDVGVSFNTTNLLYRTLAIDPNQRGKLMIAPRIISMMLGMVSASLIMIINAVNGSVGNMRTSFGITVVAMVGVMTVISLIGISLIKERYHAPKEEGVEDKVKFTDFFLLLKENKAMRVNVLCSLFGGFIWTFLFSTGNYYIKWGLCTDLATGQVDADAYGLYSLIISMMMFLPLVIGTFIASPLMKKIGSPMKFQRILLLCQAIPCGLLFVFQMIGLLEHMPWLFLLCVGVCTTAIGCGFIPGNSINLECMDYNIYKLGKDRSALCNAMTSFISKAQSAVATASVGFMLVAIGYVVDSVTGDFAGDVAQIPVMLDWFIVMMGLIPFVLGMLAWFVTRWYPITPEIRVDMEAKLRGNKE